MVPVTYYPPATQRTFAANARRIAGKPYAHYFRGDLVLHEDILPMLSCALDPARVPGRSPAELNRLLEPGYQEVENGWCALPDGTAYVASLTRFPGVTGEMFRWWFWWHAVEPERYSLWYPHNHIEARSLSPELLTRPGLRHEQRYIGTTHAVREYIGPELVDINISFIDPASWGFDTRAFAAAGIVGHACADVALRFPRLRIGTMVHLARETHDGLELRSRYWLADTARFEGAGLRLDLGPVGAWLGIKRRLAGERLAYEQFLHDQIEFTHLASFLPRIYAEFGGEGACLDSQTPETSHYGKLP